MKTHKMFAKLGDQLIPVGSCNSAQARILVRDNVAVWQEGDLVLFVRQAHIAILDNNPDLWSLPMDEENGVGQREIDRRRQWFTQFMPKWVNLIVSPKVIIWDKVPHVLTSDCIQYKTRTVISDPALASDQPDEMGQELIDCWKQTNPDGFAVTLDPFHAGTKWAEVDDDVQVDEFGEGVDLEDHISLSDPTAPDLWQKAVDSYKRIHRIQNLPWDEIWQNMTLDVQDCDIITKQE